MFTGIIEGLGTISGLRPYGQGLRLGIESDFELAGTRIGDSIAVNGACLTAVAIGSKRFEADVSPETLASTTFDRVKRGERVNLERALRLSDRLDGHLVSGHIDGTGILRQRRSVGNAVLIAVEVPTALARYMIYKGSVAVDGISLTINHCSPESFEVSIIPHTAGLTTVGLKPLGTPVNVETDLIAKYVERFVSGRTAADDTAHPSGHSPIDKAFLVKSGFL